MEQNPRETRISVVCSLIVNTADLTQDSQYNIRLHVCIIHLIMNESFYVNQSFRRKRITNQAGDSCYKGSVHHWIVLPNSSLKWNESSKSILQAEYCAYSAVIIAFEPCMGMLNISMWLHSIACFHIMHGWHKIHNLALACLW